MRILVTGSRTWDDVAILAFNLGLAVGEAIRDGKHPVVVHGDCAQGADRLADRLCRYYGIPVEIHPAEWGRWGKTAGLRRNAEMVALGADVCLAFIRDTSRGATHCAHLAEQAGIPVRRFTAP